MKIKTSSLETIKESNVYELKRQLKAGECDLDIPNPLVTVISNNVYTVKTVGIIEEYCHKCGFVIVSTLKESLLEKRNNGIQALSTREADIATRSRCLDKNVVIYSLMNGCFLTEGVIGNKESGYELRRRYNKGIEWIENNRNANQQYIEKANKILCEIVFGLNAIGLFMWPEEKGGFHNSLLRPEYMTEEQYVKITRRLIVDV